LRHGSGKLYGPEGHLEYYGPWKTGERSEEFHKLEESIEINVKAVDKQKVLARFEDAPKLLDSGKLSIKIAFCITPHFLPLTDTEENWSPFIATLKQYQSNPELRYEDSVLKNFYDSYPRENLQQSFLLPSVTELKPFWELRAFSKFPLPWTNPEEYALHLLKKGFFRYNEITLPANEQNVSEVSRMIIDMCLRRPLGTWVPNYPPQMVGDVNRPVFFEYGPVPGNHGEALFNKLISVYESVGTIGYLPGLFPYNNFTGTLLLTKKAYRFIIESDFFLLNALAALGFDEITTSLSSDTNGIVERDRLQTYPFVETGVYTIETARLLFDHAFLSFKEKIARR